MFLLFIMTLAGAVFVIFNLPYLLPAASTLSICHHFRQLSRFIDYVFPCSPSWLDLSPGGSFKGHWHWGHVSSVPPFLCSGRRSFRVRSLGQRARGKDALDTFNTMVTSFASSTHSSSRTYSATPQVCLLYCFHICMLLKKCFLSKQ